MSQPEHSRELLGLRLIWMLLFLFVWLGAQYVLAVVVLVVLVVRLIKGEVNPGLTAFGAALGNYLAQIAIEQAQNGDFSGVHKLLAVLERPFDDQPDNESYAALPPDWAAHLEVSCSS